MVVWQDIENTGATNQLHQFYSRLADIERMQHGQVHASGVKALLWDGSVSGLNDLHLGALTLSLKISRFVPLMLRPVI